MLCFSMSHCIKDEKTTSKQIQLTFSLDDDNKTQNIIDDEVSVCMYVLVVGVNLSSTSFIIDRN